MAANPDDAPVICPCCGFLRSVRTVRRHLDQYRKRLTQDLENANNADPAPDGDGPAPNEVGPALDDDILSDVAEVDEDMDANEGADVDIDEAEDEAGDEGAQGMHNYLFCVVL